MANTSDEEYHFSEPETAVSYTTEPQQSGKDKDFQGGRKGRKIILLLAILMAFWAIYKFIGVLLSPPKPASHPTKPAASIPTKPPVAPRPIVSSKPQPVQPVPLSSKPPAIQPLSVAEPALSSTQIQEMSNQKVRLNKLESEIINFQSTLSEMNTKLSDLSTQIDKLASRADKPAPVVVEIKKPARPPKRRPRYHASPRYPAIRTYTPSISYVYRLQAAIPGRAWLMRSDGANITVSLGDKIPSYGTVVVIDPNDGVVQTSSGATIRYRSH